MKDWVRLAALGASCTVALYIDSVLCEEAAADGGLVAPVSPLANEGVNPPLEETNVNWRGTPVEQFPLNSFAFPTPPEEVPFDLEKAVREPPNAEEDHQAEEDIFDAKDHGTNISVLGGEDIGGVDRPEVEDRQSVFKAAKPSEDGLERLDGLDFGAEQDSVEAVRNTGAPKDPGSAQPTLSVENTKRKGLKGDAQQPGIPGDGSQLLLLEHDPLAPLLALPEPPPLRGAKAAVVGLVLLFLAMWMAFEAEESVTRGPANVLAGGLDADVGSVATLGSAATAIAAFFTLIAAGYRHLKSVYVQHKWTKRAEHGLSVARRIHQNRMHRLLKQSISLSRSMSDGDFHPGVHKDATKGYNISPDHPYAMEI